MNCLHCHNKVPKVYNQLCWDCYVKASEYDADFHHISASLGAQSPWVFDFNFIHVYTDGGDDPYGNGHGIEYLDLHNIIVILEEWD